MNCSDDFLRGRLLYSSTPYFPISPNFQKKKMKKSVSKKAKSEDEEAEGGHQSALKKSKPGRVSLFFVLFAVFIHVAFEERHPIVDVIMKDVAAGWNVRGPLLSMRDFLEEKTKRFPAPDLVFQALKACSPSEVKIVILGLAPYPREESACGIALFDAALDSWESKKLGSTVSMRTFVKAALIHKYGLSQSADISMVRSMLKSKKIVDPKSLFVNLLSQGVLLLNASLTIDADSKTDSAAAWEPVISSILESVFEAKKNDSVVFCFWGEKCKALKRKLVDPLQKRFPETQLKIHEWFNPAAQGDLFCNSKVCQKGREEIFLKKRGENRRIHFHSWRSLLPVLIGFLKWDRFKSPRRSVALLIPL